MRPQYEEDTLSKTNELIESLIMSGWSMVDDFVSERMVKALREESREMERQQKFLPANAEKPETSHIHGDRIAWLNHANHLPNQSRYLQMLEDLRKEVNRLLYLGLQELEAHTTIYMPGSCYIKHLDSFQGENSRLLTVVLYLNNEWIPSDGGEFRLYFDETDNADFIDIPPKGGRLVAFLSNRFPHEVLPTQRERLSITCWYGRRDSV